VPIRRHPDLGKVHFSKGDVDKALQFFREVVSLAPGSVEAVEAAAYIKELEQAKPSK
jgi:Flp pilus assembly protein TadD